jgi:CheY-like chemotaxis protein
LPPDAPKTIARPWAALLLQVVRQVTKNGRQNSLGAVAARPAAGRKTGKKILAIDDTEMLLIFVADVLGTADQTFQIITAATGGEGLKLAATTRPDLVLLDYSLTDMNGDDVCRGLLANEVTARIPVLMMSGHLTEMATTAQMFRNVVATLAKPFLSGALINAVEKVLAAGPLPKSRRPPPVPKVAPPAPALPFPPGERPPNEHGRVRGAGTKDGVALDPTAPAQGLPPDLPILATAELAGAPVPAPVIAQSEMVSTAMPADGRTPVSVTLAFEVISVRLTPLFQIDALKLRLAGAATAVKMADRGPTSGMTLETGFRLGLVGLGADGQADTIRLIPTRQPPQLAAAESSFPVGDLSTQPANVELAAPERASMHVQLTAQFELLMVELSDGFEVVAVLLKSGSPMVRVSNGTGSAGAQFEIKEVQLNPLAQLETLLLRLAP